MVTLLPGGFLQLLPILQRVASMHLGHIQEVARGTLASGTGAPSEQEAMACLLRILRRGGMIRSIGRSLRTT